MKAKHNTSTSPIDIYSVRAAWTFGPSSDLILNNRCYFLAFLLIIMHKIILLNFSLCFSIIVGERDKKNICLLKNKFHFLQIDKKIEWKNIRQNKENSTAVFSIHFWDIFHWWNIMQMKFFHFGFVTYHFWSILTACNLMKIPWNYAKTVKIGSKKLATLTIGGLSFLNGNRSLQRFFWGKINELWNNYNSDIFKLKTKLY